MTEIHSIAVILSNLLLQLATNCLQVQTVSSVYQLIRDRTNEISSPSALTLTTPTQTSQDGKGQGSLGPVRENWGWVDKLGTNRTELRQTVLTCTVTHRWLGQFIELEKAVEAISESLTRPGGPGHSLTCSADNPIILLTGWLDLTISVHWSGNITQSSRWLNSLRLSTATTNNQSTSLLQIAGYYHRLNLFSCRALDLECHGLRTSL